MSKLANNNAFLADLTREDLPADFEEQIAQIGIRSARRARQRRSAARYGLLGIILLVLLIPKFFAAKKSLPLSPIAVRPPERSYNAVNTEPFSSIITSQALPPRQLLSTKTEIAILETDMNTKTYVDISDRQLLSLFEGRKVVLIRPPDHSAELLFLE